MKSSIGCYLLNRYPSFLFLIYPQRNDSAAVIVFLFSFANSSRIS